MPLAALSFIALAALHSYLGERLLIGPLLRANVLPPLKIGRALGAATLRFAWHLTSVAWVGLAAMALQVEAHLIACAVLATSGVAAFGASRGRHFAWALFLAGALGACGASRWTVSAGLVAGVALAALSALHVAWALGLRWGLSSALPTRDGQHPLKPGRALTVLVALALGVGAWLALGLGAYVPGPPFAQWLGVLAALVFGARVIGDGRFVGLFKRVRGSRFATLDDLLFTPVCFGLSACFAIASA